MLLACLWAAVSGVFWSRGIVGTGEAFNYSLALDDTLKQIHAGVFPPLVGQTQSAFNSRLHPLRDAPYLLALGSAIDLVTAWRLSAATTQNLSLIASIGLLVFGSFFSLRVATRCSDPVALFCTLILTLCPAYLSALFTMDLFMTVHAIGFLPPAICFCVIGARERSLKADCLCAACLAALWLAHPPVAQFATVILVVQRAVAECFADRRHRWRNLGFGAAVFALLSCFVFVSVATLRSDIGLVHFGADNRPFVQAILGQIDPHGFELLRPFGASPDWFQAVQPGYAILGMVIVGLSLSLASRSQPWAQASGWLVQGAAALVLILVSLPIPDFTRLVWSHLPTASLELTNIWPTYRTYPVAACCAAFAFAGACGSLRLDSLATRVAVYCLAALASLWSAREAFFLVRVGIDHRWSLEETRAAMRPSNLDIGPNAYAFMGIPHWFIFGVTDPSLCLKLETMTTEDSVPVFGAFVPCSHLVARQSVLSTHDSSVPFVLKPSTKYLLRVRFATGPFNGWIRFHGPSLSRQYRLPSAGSGLGFGMLPGESDLLPVWTDQTTPEPITVEIVRDSPQATPEHPAIAELEWLALDLQKAPIQVRSLFPLRVDVDTQGPGQILETPRRFLSGYRVSVNGVPAAPLRTPSGQLAVGVPVGHSTVTIDYVGTWPLRLAFWVTFAAWITLAVAFFKPAKRGAAGGSGP